MRFIEKNEVFNQILNGQSTSNIWVLNPKDVKGTSGQIKDGRGYLIFRRINNNMTIDDIRKDGLVFIELEDVL